MVCKDFRATEYYCKLGVGITYVRMYDDVETNRTKIHRKRPWVRFSYKSYTLYVKEPCLLSWFSLVRRGILEF